MRRKPPRYNDDKFEMTTDNGNRKSQLAEDRSRFNSPSRRSQDRSNSPSHRSQDKSRSNTPCRRSKSVESDRSRSQTSERSSSESRVRSKHTKRSSRKHTRKLEKQMKNMQESVSEIRGFLLPTNILLHQTIANTEWKAHTNEEQGLQVSPKGQGQQGLDLQKHQPDLKPECRRTPWNFQVWATVFQASKHDIVIVDCASNDLANEKSVAETAKNIPLFGRQCIHTIRCYRCLCDVSAATLPCSRRISSSSPQDFLLKTEQFNTRMKSLCVPELQISFHRTTGFTYII